MTTLEPHPPARLQSLDAFRGLIMLFMASAGLGLPKVADSFPESGLWQFLKFHTTHALWVGGGAWDMIQPCFMFMVGVALPFSAARRNAIGESHVTQLRHTITRSLILVGLGIFLATGSKPHPDFIFTNVLCQIGLGYPILKLLSARGIRIQCVAIATIGLLCWLAFVLYPSPLANLNPASLTPMDSEKLSTGYGIAVNQINQVLLPGFFNHWNMNANVAASFDTWFLNLFPRDKPFVFNNGGYQTLNFVPSIITMTLGLLSGELLKSDAAPISKMRTLLVRGAICVLLGIILGHTCCPLVKRIWTPSWAIYSGGIATLFLAAFYWIVDIRNLRSWSRPLQIVGTNSIAIYLAAQLLTPWIRATAKTYLGTSLFSGTYGIVTERSVTLAALWLMCFYLHRNRFFIRI